MVYLEALMIAAAFGLGAVFGRFCGVRRAKEWKRSLKWRFRLREYVLTQRLKETARCFRQLSRAFCEDLDQSYGKMLRESAAAALEETAEELCGNCKLCRNGRVPLRRDAWVLQNLVMAYELNGEVGREDLPETFAQNCREPEAYVQRLNREMQSTRGEENWRRRFLESRRIAGEELGELTAVLNRLAESVEKPQDVTDKWEGRLKAACRSCRLDYLKGMLCEQERGHIEIFLQVKASGSRLVPTRELREALCRRLGRVLRPAPGSRTLIAQESVHLEFEEIPELAFASGVAAVPAADSDISGDSYSIVRLPGGRVLICVSDGMGTGRQAYLESEQVVSLCEQMMEAGISLPTAAHMLNASLLLQEGEEHPATLELHWIDLYKGEMESVKQGTPPAFLWQNGKVRRLETGQAPLGWSDRIEPEILTTRITEGTLLVMLTDGVLEAFPGEEKETFLEEILRRIPGNNPQAVADSVLNLALGRTGPRDDLTVVAAVFDRAEELY